MGDICVSSNFRNKRDINTIIKKIICKIKISQQILGFGFLCNISHDESLLLTLITNYSIFNKDDFIDGNIHFIVNKKEYILRIYDDTRIYRNKKYDITIIEIKDNSYFTFLDIDWNIFKNYTKLYEKEICSINYSYKDINNYEFGYINSINDNIIFIEYKNNIITERDKGGIILDYNNCKVLGIKKNKTKVKGILILRFIIDFYNITINEKNITNNNKNNNFINHNPNNEIQENINKYYKKEEKK